MRKSSGQNCYLYKLTGNTGELKQRHEKLNAFSHQKFRFNRDFTATPAGSIAVHTGPASFQGLSWPLYLAVNIVGLLKSVSRFRHNGSARLFRR